MNSERRPRDVLSDVRELREKLIPKRRFVWVRWKHSCDANDRLEDHPAANHVDDSTIRYLHAL